MKRKEEAPAKGADTVKEWMEAHPQEYAQLAAKMKTEGIGGVLKLAETAEISSKLAVTDFVAALKAAYPQHSIVGHRQVQKSVNYLKNLSPNRKQYGKDEPEHRFAIDIIKTEVLLLATETAD